jgi:antirestriction protein ArdC
MFSEMSNQTQIDLAPRFHAFSDDGHSVKLFRAVELSRQASSKYQDKDWILLKGDEIWDKIANIVIEAVEAPGPTWVFPAGKDAAWEVSTETNPSRHVPYTGITINLLQNGLGTTSFSV